MFLTITALLRVLAKVAGARGVDAGIVDAMIFGANLVEEGIEGRAELEALTKRIQALVDEGRHFTEAERAELRAQSDAAHNRLQALADDVPDDAGPDTEPEPEREGDAGSEPEGDANVETPADEADTDSTEPPPTQ